MHGAIDSHAAPRHTGRVDGGKLPWARAGERSGQPEPPKEQPPRNLSGTPDRAGLSTLWKAAGTAFVRPTEGVSQLAEARGESSQVPVTEGAATGGAIGAADRRNTFGGDRF